MKKIELVIILVLIVIPISQVYGLSIPVLSTDGQTYTENKPLLVYGNALPNETIIFRLYGPDNNVEHYDQINADENGNFNQILIRWPNATSSYPYGTYSIEGIFTKENQTEQNNVEFIPFTPIINSLKTITIHAFAPQTATINQTVRIYVQVLNNDGKPASADNLSTISFTSHFHQPDGTIVDSSNVFTNAGSGYYYVDFTPQQEGFYVFHITAFSQGYETNTSVPTFVTKYSLEKTSNQLDSLSSSLNKSANEIGKFSEDIQDYGSILDTSQKAVTEISHDMSNNVNTTSVATKRVEDSSGQLNALFLPTIGLISIIIALQITILAKRNKGD